MRIILLSIGSLLFVFSAAAYIYVKLKLRPKEQDFDETYWEFEDTLPELERYIKFSRITFSGMIIGALMLFLSLVI